MSETDYLLWQGDFVLVIDEFDRYLSAVRIWGATHCPWYDWPVYFSDSINASIKSETPPTPETWERLAASLTSRNDKAVDTTNS